MRNYTLDKANTRGHSNQGWLNSYFTFSFAGYYNPAKIHFGALRVLNDDVFRGGTGFGTHPHDNMEIVTIMLEGATEHKDSMGNISTLEAGEVQVMSAGTGLQHSEYNKYKDRDAKLLQIWVFPNELNVTPRYEQKAFNPSDRKNIIQQIIGPATEGNKGLWMHQNAWFSLTQLDEHASVDYTVHQKNNGVYLFVISGEVIVDGHSLEQRDGLGIENAEQINLMSSKQNTEVLIMEVPMIR